jgi:hypothetical protein
MIRKFEIIKLINHHNRGQFIFARHIGDNNKIIIREVSELAGIPIYHYLEMSKNANEHSQLPLDVFLFRPIELGSFPTDYFIEGQLVELFESD